MQDIPYKNRFYQDRHEKTIYAARKILSLVLSSLNTKITSAIDIGCGVGTWLLVLKEFGVKEVLGLDGPWIDKRFLKILPKEFKQIDFSKEKIILEKKYDLAICLEVVEHLPPSLAEGFIDSLTKVADIILFSAAIPFQGGKGHINEQWPEYWINLFDKHNFTVIDFLRKYIWTDRKIPVWYRQNILLFVKKEKLNNLAIKELNVKHNFYSIVHPEVYLNKMKNQNSVKGSWKLFKKAIKNYIKMKIKRWNHLENIKF